MNNPISEMNTPEIHYFRMYENQQGELPFFIRRYIMKNGTKVDYHCHEYLQINYVIRGTGHHLVNNGAFQICKGDIFVIPPDVPHALSAENGNDVELIEFEFLPTFINESFEDFRNIESFLDFAYIEPFLVAENKVKPRLNLAGKLQTEVEQLLLEALMEFEKKASGFELMVKSLLLKLLVIVGRTFTENLASKETSIVYHRHREDIFHALDYMKEHYNENLNVTEVARRFALSPSYFRFLFKNITMNTFVEYLNNIRIVKACELLCTTDLRVLDISLETGFNNLKHFNEVFRQITGFTPLQYRKHNRNTWTTPISSLPPQN